MIIIIIVVPIYVPLNKGIPYHTVKRIFLLKHIFTFIFVNNSLD